MPSWFNITSQSHYSKIFDPKKQNRIYVHKVSKFAIMVLDFNSRSLFKSQFNVVPSFMCFLKVLYFCYSFSEGPYFTHSNWYDGLLQENGFIAPIKIRGNIAYFQLWLTFWNSLSLHIMNFSKVSSHGKNNKFVTDPFLIRWE